MSSLVGILSMLNPAYIGKSIDGWPYIQHCMKQQAFAKLDIEHNERRYKQTFVMRYKD